jgi:hypothetical protein
VGSVIAHPTKSNFPIDGAFVRNEKAKGAAAMENGMKIKNANFDKRS